MTTPTPLKGKEQKLPCIVGVPKQEASLNYFYSKDVRSAVEWLKEKFIEARGASHKLWEQCSCVDCVKLKVILLTIDKAFSDVIEE